VGKPTLLSQLCTLSQSIDARYWERRSEISRETPATTKNPMTSKPASEQQNNSKPSTSSQKPMDKKADHSTQRPAPCPSPNATPASRNLELQGKLGKDGKLTAEERQRRFDNKLCMFCGGTGHMAHECNKRNKDQKAQNTTIKPTEPAPVAESLDSKK